MTYRDVVILNRDGSEADVFNLSDHNLSDTEEYAALRDMILEDAGQEQ